MWVGHLEIAALARIYNIIIHIYYAGGIRLVNEEIKDKRGDVFISYHNEKHYNSVVPNDFNPDEDHKLLDNLGEIEQWIRALMRVKSQESSELEGFFKDEKEVQVLDEFIKDHKDDLYKREVDLNKSMKNSNCDLRDIDSVINERYNLKSECYPKNKAEEEKKEEQEIEDMVLNKVLKESENEFDQQAYEQAIEKMVIQESLKDSNQMANLGNFVPLNTLAGNMGQGLSIPSETMIEKYFEYSCDPIMADLLKQGTKIEHMILAEQMSSGDKDMFYAHLLNIKESNP
jgi:hypothetical protein